MLSSITLLAVNRNILDINQKLVFVNLPVVKGAAFDSYSEKHNATCLLGIRGKLLDDIYRWANGFGGKSIF